ncbi:putative membrane protein (TIGR02234 family) [Streptacidiphilus sp. MAP12-33]|uniref:TIGR02234 family membrane protein n=1 Tax=Streptacidiphilus sp. MAP12-33 TaxID=3156266 RepID=UPI0035143099
MSPEQSTATTPPVEAAPTVQSVEADGGDPTDPTDPTGAERQPSVPARAGRRSLALTLLFAVAGATLLLVAAGQTWVTGHAQAQGVTRTVVAQGGEVTGVPGAMALVGLASVVAVFAVRGRGRKLLGVLVALAGVGAVATAVSGALGSESHALDEKASRSVGLSDIAVSSLTHTGWPWAAVVGGLLVVAAGASTVLRGRDWPGMSARYDAPAGKRGVAASARKGTAASAPAQQTPADLWKALDRGEDPTAS